MNIKTGLISCIAVAFLCSFGYGKGYWYLKESTTLDSGSTTTPTGWPVTSTYGFAGEGSVTASKTRNVDEGADRTSNASIVVNSIAIGFLANGNTGTWESKGSRETDVRWFKECCPGGDEASRCHTYPANNRFKWRQEGKCQLEGTLDANNGSLSQGSCQVYGHATLQGTGKCDIDAEATADVTLSELGGVTIDAKVEKGGGGAGISIPLTAPADTLSITGFKLDATGDAGALGPGDSAYVVGDAITKAVTYNGAYKADITATTTITKWLFELIEGGTHESGCPCNTKPHGGHDSLGAEPASLTGPCYE